MKILGRPTKFMGLIDSMKDGSAFQLKVRDRASAGKVLGAILKGPVAAATKKHRGSAKPLVALFSIPRGGVIVADPVADALHAEYFGIVLSRKLRAPDNKENSIGAVSPDGQVYLDDFMVSSLKISAEYIASEKDLQLRQIAQRADSFMSEGNNDDKIHDAVHSGRPLIIVLIDDGIATGATVIASARWLQGKFNPRELIVGAPIASKEAVDRIKSEGYEAVAVTTSSNFVSVNQFYRDFDQSTDVRVREILTKRMTRC